jgi:hypothetical protein
MRRVTLILATFAMLFVAVGQAQAHHPGGYYGGYRYGGYYPGPVVVRSPVWVGPRVIAPAPDWPIYRARYYAPAPSYGFYYQGRGVSVGVGF